VKDVPFSTADPLGRIVVLTQARWNKIASEHPEVKENVVKSTIEEPHLIVSSDKRPTHDVYFRLGTDPDYPHLYSKVVVDFTQKAGSVTTAMYQKNLQGADFPGGIRYANYRRN